MSRSKHRPFWPYLFLFLPITLLGILLFLQTVVAHSHSEFRPSYPQVDIAPTLYKETLSEEDYQLLFQQTGLSQLAIDPLLTYGDLGKEAILDYQTAFFDQTPSSCDDMLGLFTKEHHRREENGTLLWAPPPAMVQPGDILLTFDTHSLGWHHGHGGIVLSAGANGQVLEAPQLGSVATRFPLSAWQRYASYIVLRPVGFTAEEGQAVADYAVSALEGAPYRLLSGWLGTKAPEPEDWRFGVHCTYLVWYAYQHFGLDLDSDGGCLVSADDLYHSPYLEVVQVYGMDTPEGLLSSQVATPLP